MARKKKKDNTESFWHSLKEGLTEDTRHGILALFALAIAIFFTLAPLELSGLAGEYVFQYGSQALGAGYVLLPLVFYLLSVMLFRGGRPHLFVTTALGSGLFALAGLGLIDIFSPDRGGLFGHWIAEPFEMLFGFYVGSIFLFVLCISGILILFNTTLPSVSLSELSLFKRKGDENEPDATTTSTGYEGTEDDSTEEEDTSDQPEDEEEHEEDEDPSTGSGEEREPAFASFLGSGRRTKGEPEPLHEPEDDTYTPPPLSLLLTDSGKPGYGDLKANANIIKRTLLNFGIEVEIDEVTVGPSITRYALKPAEGVRLARIVALQNDLALALAAHPLRIEAPIPGKSLVGIEIPNTKKSTVGLASLLSAPEYKQIDKPLTVAMGRGITGNPIYAPLGKAPHMLIAGATGSGKSVSVHALILSLLFRHAPREVRFILIDPKRVELSLYKNIPHLLTPVITQPKKAILSLKWAIKEMERRYDVLEEYTVRDIDTYHTKIVEPAREKRRKEKASDDEEPPEPMPYIVIIIDELSDIMSTYPKELESAIVRLAQMSRAVGIHLVLSTQRPSVNVITGLIKANIPSRVALQVSSQVDSRTILDSAGAEKLLGAGDMLYQSGELGKPVRLQSPFVTETEVKRVAAHLKKQGADIETDDINLEGGESNGNGGSGGAHTIDLESEEADEDTDDLYEDARELVIQTGKASTSYLQRRLGVGYSRAARIVDDLEERGVVGPARGSKPREVLVSSPDGEEEEES